MATRFARMLSGAVLAALLLSAEASTASTLPLKPVCVRAIDTGKQLFFFPSRHFGLTGYELDARTTTLFADKEAAIYFEASPPRGPGDLAKRANQFRRKSGTTYPELDAQEIHALAKHVAQVLGVETIRGFQMVGSATPLLLAILTEGSLLLTSGERPSSGPGLEQIILRAGMDPTRIGGVEDANQTIPVEDMAVQAKALEHVRKLLKTVSCIECRKRMWTELSAQRESYIRGDMKGLLEARERYAEALGSRDLEDILVRDRNIAMAKVIAVLAKDNAAMKFVLVLGAGHVLGSGSVPDLLIRNGFATCAPVQ